MKIAIVTGGASGMGLETTKSLASKGYYVVVPTIGIENAEANVEQLPQELRNNIALKYVDLTDLNSVQSLAIDLKNQYDVIDVLVNNAGVLNPVHKVASNGTDYTIAANYLGHYLLTHLLLDRFVTGSRIVNITSLTYTQGKIDDTFFFPKSSSLPAQFYRYFDSKLAVMYATLDLAERLKEKGVYVNAVDPGVVGTDIIAMNSRFMDRLCDFLFRPFVKKSKEGANSAIFLSLYAHEKMWTGKLLKDKKVIKQSEKLNRAEQEYIKKLTVNYLKTKNIEL